MKEYKLIDLTGIDDQSAEEIAMSVNGLTVADRERIFSKVMLRMNDASLQNEKKTDTVEVVRKENKNSIRRLVPYISAAALLFITFGAAVLLGNRLNNNDNDTTISNDRPVTELSSAGAVTEISTVKNNTVTVTDMSSAVMSSYENVISSADDHSDITDKSYYNNIFEGLKENFDLAYLLITNSPLKLRRGAEYIKNNPDGDAYFYTMVKDSRVSGTDDIRNILRSVFSDNYLEGYMTELFGGEFPKYEMRDGELYIQNNSHGWEFEWTDDEAYVENITDDSFTVIKKRLFFSSEVYEFKFNIKKQNEVWRIDDFSYEPTGETIESEINENLSGLTFTESRAESLVSDYLELLSDMQNPETDNSAEPYRVIITYENGSTEEYGSYPVMLHKSIFSSFENVVEEYNSIFSAEYTDSQRISITGADDGIIYEGLGPYFEKDGILYGIMYDGKGYADYYEGDYFRVYDISEKACRAEKEVIIKDNVSQILMFNIISEDDLWKIDSVKITS